MHRRYNHCRWWFLGGMVKMEKNFLRIEFLYNFETYAYRYAFGTKTDGDIFYGVPVCADNIFKYDLSQKEITLLKRNGKKDFDYTGACYDTKRKCIWGIPRNANTLLRVDTVDDKITEIPLNKQYAASGIHGAHHYTGILVDDKIYCPPRHLSSGILEISLDNFQTDIIPLDENVGRNSHYSGSILHSNGYIYFTPSIGNNFVKFDPASNKIKVIEEKIEGTIFGGVEYKNDIYCFSSVGIIKFDVKNESIEILYKFENKQTYYGTILHPNGKIYSWNQHNQFVEYNIETNEYKVLATIYDKNNGPVYNAGGVVMGDDNIYFTPCQGRFFMRAVFGNV